MPLIAGKDEIPSGKKAGYTWGNGHMKGVCTGTAARDTFILHGKAFLGFAQKVCQVGKESPCGKL